MNEVSLNPAADLPLPPDFAERVIRRADVVAQRRRGAWALAAMSVMAVGVVAGWALQPAMMPAMAERTPAQTLNRDLAWVSAMNEGDRADTLGVLFPDAAPLAQFQARYATPVADDGVQSAVNMPAGTGDGAPAP